MQNLVDPITFDKPYVSPEEESNEELDLDALLEAVSDPNYPDAPALPAPAEALPAAALPAAPAALPAPAAALPALPAEAAAEEAAAGSGGAGMMHVGPTLVPASQVERFHGYKETLQGWQASCQVSVKSDLSGECRVQFADINKKVLNPNLKDNLNDTAEVMKLLRNADEPNNTLHVRIAAVMAYLSENVLVPQEVYSYFTAQYAYPGDAAESNKRKRHKKTLHMGVKKLAKGIDYRQYPIIQYGEGGGGECTVYELQASAGAKLRNQKLKSKPSLRTDCSADVSMTPQLYTAVSATFPTTDAGLYRPLLHNLYTNWREVQAKFSKHKYDDFSGGTLRTMCRRLVKLVGATDDLCSAASGAGSAGASGAGLPPAAELSSPPQLTAVALPHGLTPVGQSPFAPPAASASEVSGDAVRATVAV